MTEFDRIHEAFFQQAPGLLCILDWDGRLRQLSGVLAGLADDAAVPGAALVDLVHDEDGQRLRESLAAARAGQPAPPHELRLRCKDGEHRRFHWSVRADAEARALYGVLSDHGTERQERRQFRFLVEAMPDMIGTSDFAGQTMYINASGCHWLGYTLEEAVKLNIMAFVPPHLHARYQTEILPAVMRDGTWTGEVELMRKDGSIVPANQVIVVVPDETGKPEALATLARDITEQKRLEDALRQAIQELSTPIIQVWEGVLALPIVGVVDSHRASQMMATLLEAISTRNCKVAVLDLTGVRTLDTATIDHLFRMVRAASLLGSRCVVSGMSPAMAQTVAGLGLDMGAMQAYRSLEEALRFAMSSIRR